MKVFYFLIVTLILLYSCEKDENSEDYFEINFQYDSVRMEVNNTCYMYADIILHGYELSVIEQKKLIDSINIEWSVEDDNILEITDINPYFFDKKFKKIKAKNTGRTKVTVTAFGRECIPATCYFNIYNIYMSSIKMEENIDIFVGHSYKLNVLTFPVDATNKNILWSSSDQSVAIVENGIIKAISMGECIITAKSEDGKSQANCKVNVKNILIESVIVNELQLNNKFMIGDEIQLTYSYSPNNVFNKNVKITSSNESVISIDENFKMKAISKGLSTIRIESEDGNASASYNVEVGDITMFVSLYVSGSSINIGGYVTGSLSCMFKNDSKHFVKLTSLVIYDGYGNILKQASKDIIGIINACSSSNSLNNYFNDTYLPRFVCIYEYDNHTYTIEYKI